MILKLRCKHLQGLTGCEITWFSNDLVPFICYTLDLEGCEITWFSNMYHNIISIILGLEGYEITWYSNSRLE